MATLEGKTVAVVGGSSGIGFGVAKASLLSLASRVVIASSSREKVENAVERLQAAIKGKNVPGIVTGDVVDATDSASVKAFVAKLGEVDHFVWTSGDRLRLGFSNLDLEQERGVFDVRFWGAAVASQNVKIRPGGSITLTIGSVVVKPRPGWSLAAGMAGAVDALTRGLAVDLAPVRVNVISPGYVKTELWDPVPEEQREKMLNDAAESLLVKHVADADEIAESYLFVMKCNYITGQRVEVDGGYRLI